MALEFGGNDRCIDIRRRPVHILRVEIRWNAEKNRELLQYRGVCFEMVLDKIVSGDFVGPQENPVRADQLRILVLFNDYWHVVPLVVDQTGDWFLKTIFPSRKENRRMHR